MQWNFKDIGFLHPPDVFMGSFDNEKMQAKHEELMLMKIDALKKAVENEQDPLEAMMKLHKLDHIQFLLNNSQVFKDAGRFEAAVIKLYTMTNSPFLSGGEYAVWVNLFQSCDTEKLYALGDPFPLQLATVYRISITGIEKGLSWTLSRKKIQSFEDRWQEQGIGRGKVYALDITRKNILVYLKGRQEEEVILDTEFIKTAKIREL
jgi:hypothetical protein